ncbi:hypothetical protein H0W80_05040, partial [Candidatus Saccharibacteria bacterium]|nr:hypothetical protein [Candidatus Saccharibacteria bacterium]
MPNPPHRPERPRVDPAEFDDPFFGGQKKPAKPNVYMELGDDQNDQEEQSRAIASELTPKDQNEIIKEIGIKLQKDPQAELTQLEASVLYQVDQDIDEIDDEKTLQKATSLLTELRGWREDMSDEEIRELPDYEQVKSLIIERLRSEKTIVQTYSALHTATETLGLAPEEYSQIAFIETLRADMQDWEQSGVFDYLTVKLIKENCRHNLLPTPNGTQIEHLTREQFYDLARKFGKQPDGSGQPYETFIDEEFYGKFSMQELTGYDASLPAIRLSLIPNKYTPELGQKSIEDQLGLLSNMKLNNPNLKFYIPRPLDAIMHWYALRAGGDSLVSEDAYDGTWERTEIRYIDLHQEAVFGSPCVPYSPV